MKIIRVFPRRTKATPTDELAHVGYPTLFAEADEVHVSVTFTWDIPYAEKLAKAWEVVAPVKMGGPAMGTKGEDFVSGKYLKPGYTITSRGCPNKCWFCSVWKRDGDIRELPIVEGWNILDDNLLACSAEHIKDVFKMLNGLVYPAEFTGGLEAKRLRQWHVDELVKLEPKSLWFAYDTPDDWEPLVEASELLISHWNHRVLRCYVLIGYPKDTFDDAEKRLRQVGSLGFCPMAMLYNGRAKGVDKEWKRFQKYWARPTSIMAQLGG